MAVPQGLKSALVTFEENGPDKTLGWRARGWPAPYKDMDLEKLQGFYGPMDAQHDHVMGGKKHVCAYSPSRFYTHGPHN
jgi:hypothetical protein